MMWFWKPRPTSERKREPAMHDLVEARFESCRDPAHHASFHLGHEDGTADDASTMEIVQRIERCIEWIL